MALDMGRKPSVRALPSPRLTVAAAIVMATLAAATIKGWDMAILGGAIAIPLLLAIGHRPQRGVLALAALAPLDGLLLVLPHPSFVQYWKEGFVVLILLATFLTQSARGPTGRRLPTWLPGLVGFVVLGLISGIAVRGVQALYGLKLDFFYLLLPIALWRCPLDRRERDQLVTILMVLGFVTSVYGIFQELLGGARLHSLGYAYNSTIRYSGSFIRAFSTFDQNYGLALFLMMVMLVTLPVALNDAHRTRNRLFFLSLPILCIALSLTFSRGPWLGLVIGGAYIGFRRHRILLAFAPLLLVATLYVPSKLTTVALSSTSLDQRGSGWQGNLHQVIAHPLGAGIGAAGSALEKVAVLSMGSSGLAYQPDNYYFKTVYELGVLGLWMLILFLIAAFTTTDRAAAQLSSDDGELGLGVAAGVLAAIVVSAVASYFEIFPTDLFFWLLLGVAATLGVHGQTSQSAEWNKARLAADAPLRPRP
ncbi:MAG: O-antigen ligase family protein [Actinomycetota bacterium]|nr:O-antigen ligase family protein [Actinomycetota bacterium]